jgi:hypothetical protein
MLARRFNVGCIITQTVYEIPLIGTQSGCQPTIAAANVDDQTTLYTGRFQNLGAILPMTNLHEKQADYKAQSGNETPTHC